ncbi:aminotransferase class V-fold PLP-dependent enzyme [Cystobacter fuscus]
MALALELACEELEVGAARLEALRDRFEREVLEQVAGVRVNGGGAPRVPNTSNLCFVGAQGHVLLDVLDHEGICVSSGAACTAGSLAPSHVLTAMGLSENEALGSLRFSLGPGTHEAEVERVLEALRKHVPAARVAV